MRSPIVAMLWENWRLTRVEAAQRLALGIVAGSAALVLLGNAGATVAFWILIVLHGFVYFSIARLNGGRFMDGYRPGFPLYLLYTRPVSTVTFVGVVMAYDALTCAALYVASVALLGFAFGQPLPLFSATVCLVAYHFAHVCIQYSTRSRVVQWIGAMAITLPMIPLLRDRLAPPLQVELSLAENALIVLAGVVSFGLTVAGVARQRRGDVWAALPRPGVSGYPDWFVNLFRLPCPTASATRAQVWFELKSSGLPVLAIGIATALLLPILFAVAGPIDVVRSFIAGWAVLSLPTMLVLGGNAFGIRRKQGRVYATAFMATQAYGTAQLAGLKVLVRTTCLLVALIAIGVSVWTSSSLASGWDKHGSGLLQMRRTLGTAIGALSGYELFALTIVVVLLVTMMVAVRASLTAIRARYPRPVLIASSVLLLYGLAFVARSWGMIPDPDKHEQQLLIPLFKEVAWIVVFVIAAATVYLVWRALADALLTLRHVCGALLVAAAFGTAWMTVLLATGMPLAAMPQTVVVLMLSLALLPLTVSMLAPWSLSRVRHT